METRDKLFLLAVLAGGGYAVHANWDAIRDRLGLDELAPGNVRAIELAKNENTFDRYSPNWMILEERQKEGQIELPPNAWTVEVVRDQLHRVTCDYTEYGEARRHEFQVDTGTGVVRYVGDRPAAPR